MANYNNSQAYDLSLFDMSAAPKRAEERRKEFKIVEPQRKTKKEIQLEKAKDARLVMRVVVVSLMLFTLIGMQILTNHRLNEISAYYEEQQNRLKIAERENLILWLHLKKFLSLQKQSSEWYKEKIIK